MTPPTNNLNPRQQVSLTKAAVWVSTVIGRLTAEGNNKQHVDELLMAQDCITDVFRNQYVHEENEE